MRFIETEFFPLGLVNEKSASEKQGGGRLPFWEMVFWWQESPLLLQEQLLQPPYYPTMLLLVPLKIWWAWAVEPHIGQILIYLKV